VTEVGERRVPVLVVGGSLVGLTTSALLAGQGVPHLLVESHSGTAIHPRAASFHQRTMEVFRSVGLQEAVEKAAAAEFVQGGAIMAVESLGGKELHYFFNSYNEGVEGLSPTDRLFITQVGLEPLLRDRASDLGAEQRFGWELVSFEVGEDEVRSVIRSRSDGTEEVVVSDYVVAADGAHSRVRDQLGIASTGHGSFADCVTIYFRADVSPLLGDRNLSVVYVNHPNLLGFFRFSITADSGFLAVFSTSAEDGTRDTRVGDDISTERCIQLVRTALGGTDDLPVQVQNIQRWSAAAVTAERFSTGRVFLVGDAAHAMPPTGGFGGNTGVADAHNLAWKLALVTKGLAGPGLLDSYDLERRPISALTVEQAYTRYVLRVDPSLPQEDLQQPLDDASIELGAIYRSSAVDATTVPDQPLDDPRAHSWAPGTRAPHVDLGEGRSTVDVVGRGFAVLTGQADPEWRRLAEDAERALGIPVAVEQVTDAGLDGAALVRPDGVIAWCGAQPPSDLAGLLAAVLDRDLATT
jgi:2-polyprenyl-6-methoxyphenol hydroxylase-like FAD-dependent oxidoreductase